ncbi:calnexin-like [Poecilia latipinna]|uniref:calnexin-like n=1 Tax=Poecilia formosa TaxID=48698 RepID=UPI0004438F01|nr:PREDICTED: calnexin-like [Poecilia formosa]XP_007571969.1 PREDICTED: calnexin-like [Poecilia formosa]XP_014876970.1 PREDICTED: calnexin-like [Poecilia latipinna]
MQRITLVLGMMLVSAVSAAGQPGFLESIMLSIQQRPWLMGVYVFVVGLPLVLFVSFVCPDKRFGPPDQPYYYKKTDDVQPDDLEVSPRRKSAKTKRSQISEQSSAEETTSTHKRLLSKQ